MHPGGHPYNFEAPPESLYFQRVVGTARIPSISSQKQGSHTVDAGVKLHWSDSICHAIARHETFCLLVTRLHSLAESRNQRAAGSCQSEPTLEAHTDGNVKFSASRSFEEARTPSRSLVLKNIGDTARGTPLAPRRVRVRINWCRYGRMQGCKAVYLHAFNHKRRPNPWPTWAGILEM